MWAATKKILDGSSTSRTKSAYTNLFHLNKPQLEKDTDIVFIRDSVQDLISSPITRNEGFFLLDAFTKSNPLVYIHNWGPIVISALKCPDSFIAKGLTLRILVRVVENFSSNTSFSEAFQCFIPEVVSLLLKTDLSDEEALNSCKALAVCMQHLPSVVAPFSEEIESFLMKHAVSLDFKTQEGVAGCFAAIPLCLESRHNKKSTYTDVWFDVYLKILNSLQGMLNDVFMICKVENLVNLEGLSILSIPSDEYDEDEYLCVFKKIKIISSLCESLSKMMSVHSRSNSENLRVQVPVNDVLTFLERIFSLKGHMKGKASQENTSVFVNYPLMLVSALKMLESLIINFTIIEHSGNFVSLLLKIITSTDPESSESWELKVRSAVWKVAGTWLKHYGPKGSYELVNNKILIAKLLEDVTPDQENGLSQSKGANEFKEECCAEALNALCSMFIFGGAFMDSELINEICSTVFITSCKVQQSLHPAKKFVYPYTNNTCRLNLYKCLVQASVSDPLKTKYINQAINILRFATKDPYLEVNTVCYKALNMFRFFVNTKKPLPETLTLSSVRAQSQEEESAPTGWENGFNWNVQNESSQDERSMDVSPPCQIESTYHNSMGSDSRRDLHPALQSSASPIHYSEAPENQCNGSSQLVSTQPSHSTVCNDSGSGDVREYNKSYSVEEAEIIGLSPPPPMPTPVEVCATKSEAPHHPQIVSLKPAVVIDKSNHQEAMDHSEEFPEEETGGPSSERMAENGMDADSEDEENSEEEEDEETGSDGEGNNESYVAEYPNRYSSPGAEEQEENDLDISTEHSSPERKSKRQKLNSEEASPEESAKLQIRNHPNVVPGEDDDDDEEEDDESEEDHNPQIRSPTVHEMCQDFVLAEPEEIC